MDIGEYKDGVIALFRSGNASAEQWDEMAHAVLSCSENDDSVPLIDTVVTPREAIDQARANAKEEA